MSLWFAVFMSYFFAVLRDIVLIFARLLDRATQPMVTAQQTQRKLAEATPLSLSLSLR